MTPDEFDAAIERAFPTLPPFPISEWASPARREPLRDCPSCDGEGFLTAPYPDGGTRRSECFDCEGTGQA